MSAGQRLGSPRTMRLRKRALLERTSLTLPFTTELRESLAAVDAPTTT